MQQITKLNTDINSQDLISQMILLVSCLQVPTGCLTLIS